MSFFDPHDIKLIYGLETSSGKGINQLKTLIKDKRIMDLELVYIRHFWHEMNSLFKIVAWKKQQRKRKAAAK